MGWLRWLLLGFVPLALIGSLLGWPDPMLFFLSLIAVAPLAAVISQATEQAALVQGPRVGGLLNATFGNVPDLLVGYYGVQAGLISFVQATLLGGIISNTGLIIGLCFLVAGLRFRAPRFDAREAGHHAVLMLLTVGALVLPSIAAVTGSTPVPLERLTVMVAAILLLSYLAYVAFSIFGLVDGSRTAPAESDGKTMPGNGQVAEARAEILAASTAAWPFGLSMLVLLGATAALVPVTNLLVATVTPMTTVLGWTDVFTGIVLVANAGNAAELYTAVATSLQGRLDLALSVASGSSIQIATFVTPLVILISLLSHPFSLAFPGEEVAILGLVVAIFAYVVHDGETNWLEGFQLLAIYAMAAAVFFVVPPV
jgi:Ca2+:H+ antiporter